MSTHSSSRNLFPPLDNPELTIQRRSRADPTLLNNFEMAAEGNDDLLVPDLRTMEELCQPSLNGRGGPIDPIAIQATNFEVKNDMIKQVQNSCQFHGLSGDDANKQLEKFLHITQSIKVNGVTDDALCLYLFPHSLTHHATAWFDRLPRNLINTFEQMAKMFLCKYFPSSMVTKLKNEITNFRQRPDESLFETWKRYKLSIDRCPNHNMLPVTQIDTFYNGLTLRHRDTINAAAGGTFMERCPKECYELIENMHAHHNDWDTSAQRSESSSSITSSFDTKIAALKAEMAEINKNLMRVLQVNQQVKEVTPNYEICGGPHSFNDYPATVGNTQKVYAAGSYQDDAILKNMQTNMTSLTNSNLELKNMFGQFMKMNTTSSLGSGTLPGNTITNPKEELKGITTRSGTAYQGPTIRTTSSSLLLVVEREIEATKDMMHPTLIIKPVVAPVSALKPNQRPLIPYPSRFHDQKLYGKANDQREKFFQIFKDLSFNISFADALIIMPKFSPTIKTLLTKKDKLSELARTLLNEHCSTILLKKLPEKLGNPGKFLIPCDFPRMAECLALTDLGASINLMLLSVWNKLSLPDLSPMRMTLELADHLISRPIGVAEDVFVKAITFNLDQTLRYLANYNDMMANRIGFIDMACEEYSQEVLGFSDVIESGNPTPYYDPVVSTTSPTLTLFINTKTDKSSIDEPPEVELKDLPPHLEYVFLEGDDKLPVIITEYLSVEEKTALITVLKSHKRAIAWKLFDIKGIDPKFCTHKILMEEDFEPAVKHQRRVNPKIHDVIKNEVLKLLDDALIYPISDSPWVSLVQCVPKKGCFTVVENEENEIILTRSGISKFPSIQKIRRKPHLLVHTERLLTVACFLGYAMHHARFREKMLKRCEDINLCLNWEKSHFMVKEGIVLGHKISKNKIEVNKAKVDVISKLPHPTTVKGNKYILVAVDYLSKWVKAKAFPTNDAQVVCKFLKNLFARFGTPEPLLVIEECTFAMTSLQRSCLSPETCKLYLQTAGNHKKVQLNELRDQAYENSLIYKEKTKRLHDSKIKDRVFNSGDRVLLFNSRLKIFSGKLKSCWSGPITISHGFPYGTVELSQPDGTNFKVNGHRLKHYFREDIPKMVVPDLQTFPKDQ
nr:reverse transcriptase domain-containing protein [Tanacetum cinerariifolium]